MLADTHEARGDYTQAIKAALAIQPVGQPEIDQTVEERLSQLRQRKGRSYRSAIASLLWEGELRTRLLIAVTMLVLLAANLIVVGKVARFGRIASAAVGSLGTATAVGVPCFALLVFALGEGPAFLTLIFSIVSLAAIGGALGGLWAFAKHSVVNSAVVKQDAVPADLVDRDDGHA